MEGGTLGKVLEEDAFTSRVPFLGVLTLHELPKEELDRQVTIALIVNTHPDPAGGSTQGEHWVAIYGDKRSPALEYFDSYGQPPFRDEFHRFFRCQKRPWIYNQRALQEEVSSTCGYYCLHYLLLRCRGHRMIDITLPFTEDKEANDRLVQKFVHSRHKIPRVNKSSLLR